MSSDRSTIGTWWRDGRPILPIRWTHTSDLADLTWVGRAANRYHRATVWLRPSWWRRYVWPAPPRYHRNGKTTHKWSEHSDLNRWRVRWCRIKGHPNGTIYFNPGGYEPDDRCQDCGENLG